MSILKLTLDAAVLTLALWFIRLSHESVVFTAQNLESLWLWIFRPVLLAVLGIAFVHVHMRSLKLLTRRQYFIFSYIAAALFCLSYLPDMYASFTKAGESRSILLSAAFYLLGIITYGTLRGGLIYYGRSLLQKKFTSSLFKSVIIYPVLLIAEFCFFHTWHPITYFPALPLPLPSARFEQITQSRDVEYLLLESHIDGVMRQEIKKGGTLSLGILGKKIASAVEQKSTDVSFSPTLHILLPETFVAIEEPSDILAIAEPVAEALFRSEQVSKIVWIQGAYLADSNVILGTELQKARRSGINSTEKVNEVVLLRKKVDQMPMFEVASKGISYSSNERLNMHTNSTVSSSQPSLKEFAEANQLLICYESLFPLRWEFGKPTIVFTNHHLFTEYKLMNWVYFGFLRQLSFFFASETKVISNYNPSGVLKRALFSNQKASDSWSVVSLSLEGE